MSAANENTAPGEMLAKLFQITAPHFCAGLVMRVMPNLAVVEAAPIVRYMIGWPGQRVQVYCDAKHWHLAFVENVYKLIDDLP